MGSLKDAVGKPLRLSHGATPAISNITTAAFYLQRSNIRRFPFTLTHDVVSKAFPLPGDREDPDPDLSAFTFILR
jgi:hypothetical protein